MMLNTTMLSIITISISTLNAKCSYGECYIFTIKLSAIMPTAFMLSVAAPPSACLFILDETLTKRKGKVWLTSLY
jgi:hypothetical protein